MVSLRIANSHQGRPAGPSLIARPGRFSFERGGALVIAAVLIGLGTATAALGGVWVTSLACALLLVVGLPHGALDIAALRSAKSATQLAAVGAYLAAATTMFAVWMVSPLAGLAAFYAVAIVHFADDWDQADQSFFGHAIAVALLSAPAVLHASELGRCLSR